MNAWRVLPCLAAGVLQNVAAATLAMILLAPTALGQAADAEALGDRVLERLGGRAARASLNNTINGSQQNRAGEPTVVYAVITVDF